MSKFFITGTGTDVGKTYIITRLIKQYQSYGKLVKVIKPIISGWEAFKDNPDNLDTVKIIKAMNLEVNLDIINKISPFRLDLPLSPDIACKALSISFLDYNNILSFCTEEIKIAHKNQRSLLIEGVGGIMVPINQKFLVLDLIKQLGLPVILVTNNYLGTINHTLSSIKCLENYDICVKYVVMNNYSIKQEVKQKRSDLSSKTLENNIKSIQNFTSISVITLEELLQKI